MSQGNWYKVDNVAKVFLATAAKRDTRTLRVSCTLTEDIEPAILQEALLATIQIRPQFQVRIRRGFFWHYMEDTDIEPIVSEESGRICPLLYVKGKSALHYKVSYFKNRINVDLFHALADGTGALEFLNILVHEYLKLKYPGKFENVVNHSGASEDDLFEDSYKQFYESKPHLGKIMKFAYHPTGLKLPYDQLQFFELHIPTDEILPKAKELGISLTSYLGANLMIAIMKDMPTLKKGKKPVTVAMPVNLRNYYPSNTSRNFFNNVSVSHTFKDDISLEDLAKEFDKELKESLSPENIKGQMDKFETMEYVAPVRAVPLIFKQISVMLGSKVNDRKVSVVLSNLGVRKPAEELKPYISNYGAFCSSANLFVVCSSYNGDLTLGVTSPYMSTGVIKDFVRGITDEGIHMKVYATEVIR